jgi:predicted ATP-binding protein involved in virulence
MNHQTPTRLDSLSLSNFRCFSNFSIQFDEKLTVIVAPNAGGKTAVLDAVAVSLRLLVDTLQTKAGSLGFAPGDIRLQLSSERSMEPMLPTRFDASGHIGGEKLEWSRQIESVRRRARTTTPEAKSLKNAATQLRKLTQAYVDAPQAACPVLPLLAYYGTGRLFGIHRLTNKKKSKGNPHTSRFNGYEDCLSSSSRYKFFVDWFERFSREAQQELSSGIASAHHPGQRLRAVKNAVNVLLAPSQWGDLAWDFAEGTITATHPDHGTLPVDRLSDGIRNMIGLAADIAHRCVRLNPQFMDRAAFETHGIVLIDEIDMHLHPEWQQLVLPALCAAFPMVQFIVTTHSPQVLTTVKQQSIRMLTQYTGGLWTAAEPREETKGVQSSSALAGVMHVDPIPPVQEARDLSRYQQLIQLRQHESEEGANLRALLDTHFGPHHPLVLDCDRLIRLEDFKAKLPVQKPSQPTE